MGQTVPKMQVVWGGSRNFASGTNSVCIGAGHIAIGNTCDIDAAITPKSAGHVLLRTARRPSNCKNCGAVLDFTGLLANAAVECSYCKTWSSE